jgi:DnaJ family protein B protein 12
MEVNKEEAVRCLSIAKNHFGNGNYTSAVKAFLVKAEARAQNAGSSATATGSSANASSSAESTKRREHKAQAREYTQEQIEAVKRIRACGTDYYKVLSLEKTCTETEIKKSYRKVRY